MDLSGIRKVLATVHMGPSNEELGRRESVYPADGRRSAQFPDEVANPVMETSQKLMEFRLLVGITTHHSFKAPRGFNRNHRPIVTISGRPAPNMGIYTTVVDNEIKCKRSYKFSSRLINGCLFTQIIVAAALTALGAANGSNSAVTVFGAINTVIAGFLAYLKGSGLPHRFKYFAHEWAKVREYIEQRERDLTCGESDMDVHEQVDVIRTMFEAVRADVELNTPDRFVSVAGLSKGSATISPSPSLSLRQQEEGNGSYRGTSRSVHRMNSGISDGMRHKKGKTQASVREVRDVEKEAEGYGTVASSESHDFGSRLVDDVSKLKSMLEEKMKEIERLGHEIGSHSQKTIETKENEMRTVAESREHEAEMDAEDKMKGAKGLETDVGSFASRTVEQRGPQTEAKIDQALDDAGDSIKAALDFGNPFREEKRTS